MTLQKNNGRKLLKFEEFITLMCEVAAVVNSHPLTYFYDELTSTVVLPTDFLECGSPTGIAPVGIKDPDYVPPQESKEIYTLHKANLAVTGIYWKHFKNEYLLRIKGTTVNNTSKCKLLQATVTEN